MQLLNYGLICYCWVFEAKERRRKGIIVKQLSLAFDLQGIEPFAASFTAWRRGLKSEERKEAEAFAGTIDSLRVAIDLSCERRSIPVHADHSLSGPCNCCEKREMRDEILSIGAAGC